MTTHPLHTRAMRNARAIVQRLYADWQAIRPNWGSMPDPLSRQHYRVTKDRARRRYDRAFHRYHNVMRPAALARAGIVEA